MVGDLYKNFNQSIFISFIINFFISFYSIYSIISFITSQDIQGVKLSKKLILNSGGIMPKKVLFYFFFVHFVLPFLI